MTVIAVLLTLLVTTTAAAAATGVVVIGEQTPQPSRVTAAAGQSLVFVNRSGSHVDVDFVGSSERYRIARANGSTVAIVLEPGRHPFVVRFGDDRRRHLHGVVETPGVAPAPEGIPICGAVPPGETCLEE